MIKNFICDSGAEWCCNGISIRYSWGLLPRQELSTVNDYIVEDDLMIVCEDSRHAFNA
jgi:hypothetical protein